MATEVAVRAGVAAAVARDVETAGMAAAATVVAVRAAVAVVAVVVAARRMPAADRLPTQRAAAQGWVGRAPLQVPLEVPAAAGRVGPSARTATLGPKR